MPIAIGYCRQSLARAGESRETSLSLDAQEQRIRQWAEAEHWTLTEVVRDHDLRGTTLDRPGWRTVVSACERGGVDAIVVFALSRVARDNLLQETAWRQLKTWGVRLISVTEPAAEDTMVRGILGVLSQAERERMGKFISSAIAQRVRRGTPWGEPPFGFRRTGHPGERNRGIEIDPEQEPTARRMIALALAGEGAATIASHLTASGAETAHGAGRWLHRTVRRWLRNPAIAGGVPTPDGIRWESFDGYIDRATWETIQDLLDRRSFTRSTVEHDAMLRGLVYHGCGRRMVINANKHRDGVYHLYYRCPAGQTCGHTPSIGSARRIHAAAMTALLADLADVLTVADVLAEWDAAHDGPQVARQRAALERERGKIRDAAHRAEALYLAGRRDLAWLNEQDSAAAIRLAEIEDDLAALDIPPDADAVTAIRDRMLTLRSTADVLTEADLSPILRLLGTVHLSGDRLAWRYHEDAALLIPSPTVAAWRPSPVE